MTAMDKLIRPKRLAKLLGISIPTLYRVMKQPDFPRKVHISSKAVGFRESEVKEWMDRNTEEPIKNQK